MLDQRGVLFFTKDDGRQWDEASRIGQGMLEMPPSAYQLAAMRFSNSEHGLIVVSSSPFGKVSPVVAFHTSDSGHTWTSETIPVPAGPVYLSRHGGFLTVITGANQVSLLKYELKIGTRFIYTH
ncbi:MAG TPA: hypothetical protein VJ785_01440 [Anaerolineales bacterium]|nr:hypothetical protein [Anaerolineales bacterium]